MITHQMEWGGFEQPEQPEIEWRGVRASDGPHGMILVMQPFRGEQRLCRPKDGFSYSICNGEVEALGGRVRVDGRSIAEPDDLPIKAYELLMEILSPSMAVGATATGYALLGVWRDRARNVRFGIPLEGPNAGVPCVITGGKEVTEWPERLNETITVWSYWAGWQIPNARMRIWVAELPKDRDDVPKAVAGVPYPVVIQDGAIWSYPRKDVTTAGDVLWLLPDVVRLYLRAQQAQEALPGALRMAAQVWVTESFQAALVLPIEKVVVIFPTVAHAMEDAKSRGLAIVGRMLR